MTALAELLSPRERQLLAERLAELRQVEQLVREIPEQRPAAQPPSLMALSTAERRSP